MIRAVSYFHSPGRSWPREMRPLPIAPMLMRLPGELAPSTDAGTIAGNPAAMAETAAPVPGRREELTPCRAGPAFR